MTHQTGGCLCGDLRYRVSALPIRATFCTCRYCQRHTGTPMNLLVGFAEDEFELLQGQPSIYTHFSEGSGKAVNSHFCPICATVMFKTLESFPKFVGIAGGTFDNPDWYTRTAENSRYIFASSAMVGSLAHAGIKVFDEHAVGKDGTLNEPRVLESHGPLCG